MSVFRGDFQRQVKPSVVVEVERGRFQTEFARRPPGILELHWQCDIAWEIRQRDQTIRITDVPNIMVHYENITETIKVCTVADFNRPGFCLWNPLVFNERTEL